ncbi:Secreted protein OS=Streptomyces glaucescens OX=1907 GN=SGLAU_05315 PE=4 SV=1 [Streptomyces glaucescens]
MSPDLVTPCGVVRSAAEVNAAIRALWSHPQVPLTAAQREEYARLCAELRQAERGGAVEAA